MCLSLVRRSVCTVTVTSVFLHTCLQPREQHVCRWEPCALCVSHMLGPWRPSVKVRPILPISLFQVLIILCFKQQKTPEPCKLGRNRLRGINGDLCGETGAWNQTRRARGCVARSVSPGHAEGPPLPSVLHACMLLGQTASQQADLSE